MDCPACGRDNPSGSRFCNACGACLETPCGTCGAPNPPGARFCNGCGAQFSVAGAAAAAPRLARAQDRRSYTPKHLAEKILNSRSALEGERKQVTVLFADVKGSMELAEQVDPEEWHKIIDRFFQILADGVHRFEGTVNQYTGDGIMALFGAPLAHENHAQRACYSALHLREELRRYADELRLQQGLNFSVRMGLNSGEVVVGKIGDDLRMDYTAQGHTVGLAARMEQIAEPGKVYLTQHTARLVRGYFALRDLGASTIKGLSTPLQVFELEGAGTLRTRLDVAQAHGFSRFVGRAAELATLEAALTRAGNGNGQVIGIVAEAGLGKSRLCYEFAERCRARDVRVYEAHGVAYGKMIPFLPILELLRCYFGITKQDGDYEARKKIAGEIALLDNSFSEVLPLVFDFLGVHDPERPAPRMDPEARQRHLRALIRRFVQTSGQRKISVTLVEDLQWFDAASDAILEQIIEAAPSTGVLVVLNFRPEYHARWMQKSYYQQLPLLPLDRQAMQDLLRDRLGEDPSVAAVYDLIRERTGGNPFFVEEVVQSLVEAGRLLGQRGAYRLTEPLTALDIPTTIQSVLAARIDRLADREKQVLQAAAVIGKRFPEVLLKHIVEIAPLDLAAALGNLERAEFVRGESLYPEAEYTFAHPLMQEVAYRSQLAGNRAGVHAQVARVLAESGPRDSAEHFGLIAHHWECARQTLRAAEFSARAAKRLRENDPMLSFRYWSKVACLRRPSGNQAKPSGSS